MSQIPYGYRIEEGLAFPDPVQAEKLRRFVGLYLEGASGEHARCALDIEVSAQTLYRLLDKGLYLGTDYYPPLLDEETVDRVRKARRERSHPATRVRAKPLPVQETFRLVLPEALPAGLKPEALFAWLFGCVHPAADGQKHLTAEEEAGLRSLVTGGRA